ncbi:MAG: lipoprotein [Candidatus Endonucleobacter bathymodioli]|uniref:Lipoprotein n=1 Tax=Candidatus Endonucleibacter bathymodioli TaxID=539814 RepID=A0AA90NS38_9GAMM|nr:lipoprotein [Candidatus Endonucleobacter bathymodioli]
MRILTVLLFFTLGLVGCGQKGDLYIPNYNCKLGSTWYICDL